MTIRIHDSWQAWLVLLCGVPLAMSGQQAGALFTAEQARRGAEAYTTACGACHGTELSNGAAPPLAGSSFQEKWGSRPAGNLYQAVLRMPPGRAGTLPAATYADVTAFLLERNGHEAGPAVLGPDNGDLAKVRVAPPAGAAPRKMPPPPEVIRGEQKAAPKDQGPTQKELTEAYGSSRNWLYHTHDYSGARYVQANQITPDNAGRLQVACVFQLGEQGNFQTGPIVYQGRIYVTGIRTTAAIDARTCELIWKQEWMPRAAQGWQNNRGAAIKDGYLVRGTSDGYLLALNMASGELVWARRATNSSAGEVFTMAPLIFEDKVLLGPAPSEAGISGWVGAFRLRDGEPLWKFHTIPKEGQPGAESWKNPLNLRLGGGAVWTPLSLDPERGEAYVAVANPIPDLPAHLRPGENLYTNSVVVLDVRTGKVKWHKSMVPNDSHDWDLTQVSPLYQTNVGGRDTRMVATVGKDGILRAVDRETKKTAWETAVTTLENLDVPVTREGVHACPGVFGGVQWNGPSYNPLTRMLYTPAVDWCGKFTAAADEAVRTASAMGGTYRGDDKRQGWITAIDGATGEVKWKYRSAQPVVAAVTTTSGGVVFGGELTGHFVVLDASTGKLLRRFQTGGPVGGGVVTYEEGGKQYVAVASGRPSAFWGEHPGAPTVFVFALP